MKEILDRWCKDLWIWFILAVGAVTGLLLVLHWADWPIAVKGGAFTAIIMPLHVLEEWKMPGGLHYIYNETIFGTLARDTHSLDRFPMSRLTDMITNIGLTVVPLFYAYLSTVISGIAGGLAICMMLFGFLELFAHTVVGVISLKRYRKAGKRTIYDPGLGTSIACFLPVSIYILVNLQETTIMDWLFSFVLFLILVFICIFIAEFPLRKWVRSLNSKYFAFDDPKYYSKFLDVSAYPDKEIILDNTEGGRSKC